MADDETQLAVPRGLRNVVHPSARLERSVLWDNVTVGAGCVVRDCILADGGTRIGVGVVILSYMDAIAAQLGSQIGPVIDHECDVSVLSYGSERVACATDCVVVHILKTELDATNFAAIECGTERRRERRHIAEIRRRDEIQLALFFDRPCLDKS